MVVLLVPPPAPMHCECPVRNAPIAPDGHTVLSRVGERGKDDHLFIARIYGLATLLAMVFLSSSSFASRLRSHFVLFWQCGLKTHGRPPFLPKADEIHILQQHFGFVAHM